MTDLSRRNIIGAAAGGVVVAAASAPNALAAGGQPQSGPAPRPLAGKELPSFRFPLGKQPVQDLRRRLGQGSDRRGVSGLGKARRRADGSSRRGRCANCTGTPMPPNGPMSSRAAAASPPSIRRRVPRCVDFGAGDVWYFPRGHGHSIQGLGPRRLPVHPGVRQRLLLGVRHLQHHRLARRICRPRCWPRTSACRPRPSRRFRSTRSTWPRGRCRRRCRPIPRPDRSNAGRSRTATVCSRSGRETFRRRHACGWSRSANFRSRPP